MTKLGGTVPNDIRKKISNSLRGRKLTSEHRANVSKALKGKPKSQAYLLKAIRKCSVGCSCARHNVAWNKGISPSDSVKAKISASLMGQTQSEETKRKNAEGVARARARGCYSGTPNSLELKLRALLIGAGFEFEEQKRFGRYVVDAYDPENGLVWEADGTYWHNRGELQNPGHQARRDSYLIDQGVVAVIHLSEEDLDAVQAGTGALGI